MKPGKLGRTFLLLSLAWTGVRASEQDALEISRDIQARHMPYGTLLDPVLSLPDRSEIVSYTRCGDSALWTGHYLAAEAFRYKVTGAPEALANAVRAITGIQSLVDVTGIDVLARCFVPIDSPYAGGLIQEESQHGVYLGTLSNQPYYWIGGTSRDQYSGVFFGLAVAYDMIDIPGVRIAVRQVVTRMLDFLMRHGWAVVMPEGHISTVFLQRPDQQLTLLRIGSHVNSRRFGWIYWSYRFGLAPSVLAPISTEVLDDHDSYFKFNLDTINLYTLIRLENSAYFRFWYMEAYQILRRTTDDHGNAHFNMIDFALRGPDERRDAETRVLLEEWLKRPRMDTSVDWRGIIPACGGSDRACSPIPVPDRVRTDFLWQRSPFLLHGGGAGNIESAGVDYILPYWMARYYGVL